MPPKTRSFPSSTSKETALEGGSATGGPGQHKEGPCGRWVPWQHPLGAGDTSQSATLRQTVSPRPDPRGQSCETSKHPRGCCTCQPLTAPHNKRPTSTLPLVPGVAKPNPPAPVPGSSGCDQSSPAFSSIGFTNTNTTPVQGTFLIGRCR